MTEAESIHNLLPNNFWEVAITSESGVTSIGRMHKFDQLRLIEGILHAMTRRGEND